MENNRYQIWLQNSLELMLERTIAAINGIEKGNSREAYHHLIKMEIFLEEVLEAIEDEKEEEERINKEKELKEMQEYIELLSRLLDHL